MALKIKTNNTDSGELNRRHKPDNLIVLFMGLLMLFGLIVIYAIGPSRASVLNNAYGTNYSSDYFFIKQLVSLAIGVVFFIMMSIIPYKLWLRNANKLLLIGLSACGLLTVSGMMHLSIAQCTLGACRWFDLGPLGSFQPAELLKFGIVIFLAQFLAYKISIGKLNDKEETIWPLMALVLMSLVFIIGLQKDMGTGISLIGVIVAMLFVSGLDMKVGARIGLILLAVGVFFILIAPHRIERILTFAGSDSSSTASSSSYHIEHAKIALGTGGLTGVGIGNSVQSTGYLPEAINDSVFAIIGEMFGFVGTTVIIALLSFLLMRMTKIIDNLSDMKLKLIVAGVFGWLGSHIVLNIASMIGLFPLTGITLPLLSFGGTSIIFIASILGLVFQISRYTSHQNLRRAVDNESFGSGRGIGRPRHSSRRRTY